ncbi:MAG: hypothetical protein D6728_01875 [Cyanobacteria bacterium J055]|nr:MAG: hypothetical protein D6728_01875 [Cyanobacteria bacterium J055]
MRVAEQQTVTDNTPFLAMLESPAAIRRDRSQTTTANELLAFASDLIQNCRSRILFKAFLKLKNTSAFLGRVPFFIVDRYVKILNFNAKL